MEQTWVEEIKRRDGEMLRQTEEDVFLCFFAKMPWLTDIAPRVMTPGFGYQYARRNIYFFTYFCGRTDIQNQLMLSRNQLI